MSVFLNTDIEIPSDFVKNYILNHLDNKTWIYPKQRMLPTIHQATNQIIEMPIEQPKKSFELFKFKINGYWVTAKLFKSGMLTLNSIYNIELKELFKKWAREGGGKYNAQYKSWNYWQPFSETVLKRLQELHDLDIKSE